MKIIAIVFCLIFASHSFAKNLQIIDVNTPILMDRDNFRDMNYRPKNLLFKNELQNMWLQGGELLNKKQCAYKEESTYDEPAVACAKDIVYSGTEICIKNAQNTPLCVGEEYQFKGESSLCTLKGIYLTAHKKNKRDLVINCQNLPKALKTVDLNSLVVLN